jgi:isoleucyl-tRNA synthetase
VSQLATDAISAFERDGFIDIELEEGDSIRLSGDELDIIRTGLEGWQVETERGLSVAVDTELSHDLMLEGIAREFVNRVQNMRKEADFEVIDRISLGLKGDETLKEAVVSMSEYIKVETLAEEIQLSELDVSDFVKTWDIGESECTISIRRNINS